MKLSQFAVVTALLACTAVTLSMRGDTDRVPPSEPLAIFPHEIDQWVATDFPLDPAVLQVLGDGRFLNRIYYEPKTASRPGVPAGPVGLFIGYFPTQRTGQSIHSPQNCLPGAGWTFEQKKRTMLTDAAGKQLQVGEYLITNGNERQEVLYWYRAHGRSIAGDFQAKLYMMLDAMRYNRTDGALVRVITPLQPGETQAEAHNRAVTFASQMASMLPPYIPD